MIGGEDDQRVSITAGLFQISEQPAEVIVDLFD